MKQLLIVGAFFILNATSLPGQTIATQRSSPRASLDQFLKMEINGDLLTSEGWNKVGVLLVHSHARPSDKPFTVVGENYSVHEISSRGNQADLFVTFRDLGKIDPSLRYSPPDARDPEVVVRYHLLLIGKPTPAGQGARNVAGARQWRIENPQRTLWIGLHAATQYVAEMRDKTTDPAIQKNADATLMQLKLRR